MPYRPMRESDLIEVLADRAQLDVWSTFIEFARMFYGEEAERVEVVAVWQEDSLDIEPYTKGGYRTAVIVDVAIFDIKGRLLPLVLDTQWWHERLEQNDLAQLTESQREAAIAHILRSLYTQLPVNMPGVRIYHRNQPPSPQDPLLYTYEADESKL
jgi:hypothetical protein